MEGPEIAGELYKVFKAWLAKRIVQGASESTPAMGTVAIGAGQRVDDDSGTPATAVPTTVESIAIVVTDALTVRNISNHFHLMLIKGGTNCNNRNTTTRSYTQCLCGGMHSRA